MLVLLYIIDNDCSNVEPIGTTNSTITTLSLNTLHHFCLQHFVIIKAYYRNNKFKHAHPMAELLSYPQHTLHLFMFSIFFHYKGILQEQYIWT